MSLRHRLTRFSRVWWPEPYGPVGPFRRNRILMAGALVSLTLSALALSGILTFSVASTAAAVLPGIAWSQEWRPPGVTNPEDIAVSSEGIYLAGRSSDVWPVTGGTEVLVKKYGLNGNELWTRQFGSPEFDTASAIAVHAGAVYVGGTTEGTLAEQTRTGSRDAFLRKYDVNGEEGWTKQLGTAASDHASAIAVDDTGVYLAGTTEGSFPGQRNLGFRDAFLGKFDFQGNALWIKEFGSAAQDWTVDLGLDPTGVYVLATVEDSVPPQAREVVVHKFDSAGNAVWVVRFGRPLNEEAVGTAVEDGSVYIASAVQSPLPYSSDSSTSKGFLRKFDPQGNELWTRQFGASRYLQYWSIAADRTGVYGARVERSPNNIPGLFVHKFDSDGTALWTREFELGGIKCDSLLLASDTAGLYVGFGVGSLGLLKLSPLVQASLFDEWSPRLPFVGVAAASMVTLVALRRRGKPQAESSW